MSIVILVGGQSIDGNYEHRYLVDAFLTTFGDQVTRIVSAEPVKRSIGLKIKRTLKRGQYLERIARARWKGPFGPDPTQLGKALFGDKPLETMPGGDKRVIVPSHNGPECEAILDNDKPEIIVVYGTAIIRDNIFRRAGLVTLNMHTGLSPNYRGDSTLFWPVYHDDPEHLGVTVHKLVPEVDGGDIVYTGKVSYTAGDTEADIFAKGVKVGTKLYCKAVQEALDGTIEYHPQDLSIGNEYRWIHRTVAAEKQVLANLERWAKK